MFLKIIFNLMTILIIENICLQPFFQKILRDFDFLKLF